MSIHNKQRPNLEVLESNGETESIYTHPSFAVIERSVVCGETNLFGSHINDRSFVEITVSQAALKKRSGVEYYSAQDRAFVFRMSKAQWANFVSTHNGGHTPVTVYAKPEGSLVRLPAIEGSFDLQDEIESKPSDLVKAALKDIDSILADICQETSKSSAPSKVKLKEIHHRLKTIKNNLPSNLDYSVQTSIEKVREISHQIALNTKAEIDQHAVRVGLTPEDLDKLGYTGFIPLVGRNPIK